MAGWKAHGTGKCPVCGKTFAKNSRNQKYCGSECKAEQDKRARAERAQGKRLADACASIVSDGLCIGGCEGDDTGYCHDAFDRAEGW